MWERRGDASAKRAREGLLLPPQGPRPVPQQEALPGPLRRLRDSGSDMRETDGSEKGVGDMGVAGTLGMGFLVGGWFVCIHLRN